MNIAETYFRELRDIHSSGSAVKETSYYGPLANLLNAVGKQITPRVQCIIHLQNQGAGIPDGGLFTEDQLRRQATTELSKGAKPFRGVVEAKSASENVRTVTGSEQVARYWQSYRQVLVTTYREFLLVTDNSAGEQTVAESFSLAQTEAEFWQAVQGPQALAKEKGGELVEYLKRVLLQSAKIAAPSDVANLLASYARDARHRVENVPAEKLAGLRHVFQEALGLTFEDERGEHFFRSSLVQTLFYGIFSAWVLWSRHNLPTGKRRFEWRTANWDLKIPVLRKLFSEVAEPGHLDESGLVEILDWAGDTLNRVDHPAFFRIFQEADSVQYFYEPFLEAFDPDLRKQLGVWYTPREIVQYMVARVDATLREKLNLPDGLADERVVVLDPCCGTGAFLVEVLNRITQTLREKGEEALLAHEIKRAAIERIFGFELLTAPFVVAHLQIGALVQQLGGDFAKNERAGIYLTNALTGWEPPSKPKTFLFPEFKEESDAADHVKRDAQILVILGNPPYNSFAGTAIGEERNLSEAYRKVNRVAAPQGQGLNDLYVRFFRIAERRIAEVNRLGIVCFISNYSWLEGLSFTGMRERYMQEFDEIWIDNLHGDRKISEYAPDGRTSETVFAIRGQSVGIKVGTAITLMMAKDKSSHPADIYYRDHTEARADQRRALLVASSSLVDFSAHYLRLRPPLELGLPFKPAITSADYTSWPLLTELFPVSFPGIKTSRDSVLVDIDRDRLEARMKMYFDPNVSFSQLERLMPDVTHKTARFDAQDVRKTLLARGYQPDNLVKYAYRPFDIRWLYWEKETKLLDEKRSEARPYYTAKCPILISQQKPRGEWSRPQIVSVPPCLDLMDRGASAFPSIAFSPALLQQEEEPNLAYKAAQYVNQLIMPPESLMNHVVAICHSPVYAASNEGALRQDWPRIPLPATADLLSASAELGRQVANLLDPASSVNGVTIGTTHGELRALAVISTTAKSGQLNPAQDLEITAKWGHYGKENAIMPAKGKIIIREYSPEELKAFESLPEALSLLGERTIDVYLNDVAYWRNIPELVWDYTIGGYQVLKKWLSYRESKILQRPLRVEEARLFTEITRRIAALLLLGPALDANYEAIRANTEQL